MNNFNSFNEFQNWLINQWFPANVNAAQLDGKTARASNPKVVVSFLLAEIPCLNAKISLHGDTTFEALKVMAASKIEDFIIIPPQPSAKYWRLHFKGTHDYDNDEIADGLYAYVK